VTAPAAGRRPTKPPRSAFAIGLTIFLVAFTLIAAWDWRYGTGFSVTEVFTKLTNRNPVLEALGDIEWGQLWSTNTRDAFVETLQIAILATIFGSIAGLWLALWSTRIGAPNSVVREVARLVSNVVRALPDIVWALVFVAAVGTGSLPGLLALFLFTIAVVTKLTADTIDGIDTGPIEAADAAGASHSQKLRTAVVPQILPAYASYVLYAFELNLRGAAVLGLVGAGGIGERIELFTTFGQWSRVWAIIVLFIIVVFVVDRVSTLLRRRLV
jgi:phosphonate transport system permease protein